MLVEAPASIANLGAGFDVVAVAIDAFRAWAEARRTGDDCRVEVPGDRGPIAAAVRRYMELVGRCVGLRIEVGSDVPVARGLGSSGAVIAAALVAAAHELGVVDIGALVEAGAFGEGVAAGSPHRDNVSASILGGAVVVLPNGEVVRYLPRLRFVVGVPEVEVPPNKTEVMRSVLPREVEFPRYVRSLSRVAALVAGFASGNAGLVALGMEDEVVTPARARYVPGFYEVRRAALEAGALGFNIAGAGPSVVALVSEGSEESVKKAVESAYSELGIRGHVVVAGVATGAVDRVKL